MSHEYPQPEYKYLSRMSVIYKATQIAEPLHISMQAEPWSRINDVAQRSWKCYEDSFNLLSGTINLINYTQQRRAEGKPVTTLLFMDKSGRPAAYLYRVTCDLIAKQLGTIGAEIASHKPHIRFINVGREDVDKYSDSVALALLSNVYRREDITDDTALIVDEYIASGNSIQKTHIALGLAGYADLVPGIGMFGECPRWHGHECNGIGESTLSTDIRQFMKNRYETNPDEVTSITKLLHTYGWRTVKDILLYDPTLKDQYPVPHADLLTIQSFSRPSGSMIQATQYLSSAGGFIGLSPSFHQRQKSEVYRNTLQNIAEEAFRRNLITI